MRVVSDADVIIHLSKLKKLSLLKALYSEVSIPEYIKLEILNKDSESIKDAIHSYLKVFNVSKDKAEEIATKHNIHLGEAHVKTLGEELKSSLFLSNERKVRQAAKEEGFKVVGTIGIILKATKMQIIDKSEAYSLFEKMKSPDFRIHPDILQKALLAIKEI
jgi:predicted nucleic acid-binding protein